MGTKRPEAEGEEDASLTLTLSRGERGCKIEMTKSECRFNDETERPQGTERPKV
jgi:hypothetical protein